MKKGIPYYFILPTVVLFIFILAVPLVNLVRYSLGDSNIIEGYTEWNDFANYKYLITPSFLQSALITIIWVVGSVGGMVFFGMIVSLSLNKPMKGRGIFRALAIIPWVVPHVFAATMWKWVVHPDFGFINQLLLKLNIINEPIGFLSESYALVTVIIVGIWQGTPFIIITLLAALQTIPEELEEAAELDGANIFQKFRFITLPHISSILVISTLLVSAWTIQIFDIIYIMTNGGPADSTKILAVDMYQKAFVESDLGVASAIGIALLLVVTLLSFYNLKKRSENIS